MTVWYTDSRCLLVGSTNGLWLYDIDQPDDPLMLSDQPNIAFVTVNPVDSTIAFSSVRQSLIHLIRPDGTFTTLKTTQPAVTALSFSPDGRLIAAASAEYFEGYYYDSRLQIWEMSGQQGLDFPLNALDRTIGIYFTSDNRHILTEDVRQGYGSSDLRYWDTSSGRNLWDYRNLLNGLHDWTPNDPLAPFVIIMHDHTIAIGGLHGYMNDENYYGSAVHIWDADRRERKLQIIVFERGILPEAELVDMAFNADGSQIVSSQSDGTIKFWNTTDGKQTGEFASGLPSPAVAYSPDDHFLALTSGDQIAIWDVAQTRLYATISLAEGN
jgi:WD40 repeat protein